ncbi:MAG: polysaccharide deacetylase family protein [Candidatus Latescibacterota bacterium]|nr:MAG: polysaccharide deacetylase family protein [Candidatus Latescibacterota bacterium]
MNLPGGILKDLRNGVVLAAVSAVGFLLGVMIMTYQAPSPSRNHPAIRQMLSSQIPSRGVPVLCYHYLREDTTPLQFAKILGALILNMPLIDNMDLWTQTASAFDKQMAFLKSEGYQTVGLGDLDRWRRGLATLPPKPVVITFDDGDRSVFDIAYPILERYGFTATLFVVTSKVGAKWERVDCLDWDELEMLETSGVFSIQSHSHDLHYKVHAEEFDVPVFITKGKQQGSSRRDGDNGSPNTRSWLMAIYDDLRKSRTVIESRLGTTPRFLSWPYGFGDAQLDSIASEAGFDAGCTLARGKNKRLTPGRHAWDTALWLTDMGALDPKPVFSMSWSSAPAKTPLRSAAIADKSKSFEIKRFTITARTSIRSFKKMLD